jgi:hypothetical protein
MATQFMTDTEFIAVIREFVAEGLAELAGEDRAWAERRIVEPRPIEVFMQVGETERAETMWLVTDFADGDREDYRLVYDPALITFGLITTGLHGRPVLIGLYGDFAETVRGL